MPKYQANAYLAHAGQIVKVGENLELTAEQAERLGDKVTKVETPKRKKEKEVDAS